MDGLRPGVDEAGAHPDVSRPGRHQSPSELGDSAVPVLIEPACRKILCRRTVITRLQIQRQSRQAVKVVNPTPGQLLGETAAHFGMPFAPTLSEFLKNVFDKVRYV